MRIGVLTFHRSINNGAVIQCYSLTKRLKQEFPNDVVEVIDYHMPRVETFYTPSLRSCFLGDSWIIKLKKVCKLLLNPTVLSWQRKRKAAFENVLGVLPLSEQSIIEDDTETLFDYINNNYDVVIAGSDAIWNYALRGFPNPYFLDDSIRIPKYSYAASCYGMVYEKIPELQRKRIYEILNSYEFLGIRDNESEKFVDYIGCTIAKAHTCDPTVFLDVNDLPIHEEEIKQKLQNKGFDFNKKTIGVMGSDKMCKMVRNMYGNTVQIAALYNYHKTADVNLYDLTPYEWAYVFRYFQATITTYFHGALLSLRNGIPVVCVALETEFSKNHKTKVQDFLERMGMEHCYFHSDYKTFGVNEIKKKLDYFFNNDVHDDILQRIEVESRSFNNFLSAIRENPKHDIVKSD